MAELWESICNRNLPYVKEQLDGGADVNYKNKDGKTYLIRAVMAGNKDIVSLLLEQPGIDVNAKTMFGETALHRAAKTTESSVYHTISRQRHAPTSSWRA